MVRDRNAERLDAMMAVIGGGDLVAGRTIVADLLRPMVLASLVRAPEPVRVVVAAGLFREGRSEAASALVPDRAALVNAERLSFGTNDLSETELCSLPDALDHDLATARSAMVAMSVDPDEVLRTLKAGRIGRAFRAAKNELTDLGGFPDGVLPSWRQGIGDADVEEMASRLSDMGRQDLAGWCARTMSGPSGTVILRRIVTDAAVRVPHAPSPAP